MSSAAGFDAENVLMRGWMNKQADKLKSSWRRRYLALSGNKIAYYTSENIVHEPPRGVYEIADAYPLASEKNGILVRFKTGKEMHVCADTQVAYKQWLSAIQSILPSKDKASSCQKSGWVFTSPDNGNGTRYFMRLTNESLSCFTSEQKDASMELSGIVRCVYPWTSQPLGLKIGLNKQRFLKVCFDTQEEKTSWLLTLEFAVSAATSKQRKASNSSRNVVNPGDVEDDDGVWI